MLQAALFAGLILAGQATAAALSPIATKLLPRICYTGEGTTLSCYRKPNGTPQDVDIDDIQYAADYLRNYGREQQPFWTMTAADAPNCAEWGVFSYGTVFVLAKHIGTNLDSSVLFEDIANAIDGGEGATDAQRAKAVASCLSDGGSIGVTANATRPEYVSKEYVSNGYTPRGILLKLVHFNG